MNANLNSLQRNKSMIMKFAKKCDDSRQFCAKSNIYLISNEKQTFYTKKDKQHILKPDVVPHQLPTVVV